MANRMDIELTSARDDETFTWRAAGARQPRGLVASSLLPPHSKVGDVLRAEVEIEIEGITVVSILPPKEKPPATGRIEFIGPSNPTPLVTTVLASRSDRRAFPEGERKPRQRPGDRDGRHRDSGSGPRRDSGSGPRREDDGRRAGSSPRRPGSRPEDKERTRAPNEGERVDAPSNRERTDRGTRGPAAGRREPASGRTPVRKGPVRFEPGTAHRDAFEALTPEQRPIAERLALGGLPAVRKALTDEQQRARSEGRPAASGEPLIAVAEQLLPDVKAAVWLDRAEAAIGRVDEITLRDLRATVVGAAARDEAGRALERQLREALERRVAKLRNDWEQHLQQALEDGRVLQALRLSAKPPEPTARFPGTLAVRLAELAGEAMTEETAPERWLSLLEAAVLSPVRRQIKPVGMPKDPTGEVERQARMTAGRIPALARLLGMPIPPPPKPFAGERPVRPTRPPRRRPTERPATTADRPALVAKPLIAPPEGVVGTAEGAGVAVEALVVAVEEPAVAQEGLPVAAQELVVAVEEPVVEEASSENVVADEELSQPVDEG